MKRDIYKRSVERGKGLEMELYKEYVEDGKRVLSRGDMTIAEMFFDGSVHVRDYALDVEGRRVMAKFLMKGPPAPRYRILTTFAEKPTSVSHNPEGGFPDGYVYALDDADIEKVWYE